MISKVAQSVCLSGICIWNLLSDSNIFSYVSEVVPIWDNEFRKQKAGQSDRHLVA